MTGEIPSDRSDNHLHKIRREQERILVEQALRSRAAHLSTQPIDMIAEIGKPNLVQIKGARHRKGGAHS
jgi:hypothetical protein